MPAIPELTYPADPAEAGLQLFQTWFGSHYARSTTVEDVVSDGAVLTARVVVGRRWSLSVAVLNTLAPEAEMAWEAARAAIEKRLDTSEVRIALWVPRGARLPIGEPGLSQLLLAVESASTLADGRLELTRPVSLYLRRTSTTGSVVTILGGLAPFWAQFTNRVPGSFQLNASELFRLPLAEEARTEVAERIVLAAGQPDIDDSATIPATDAWSANPLPGGRACVLGSPRRDTDEQSATLRRNLRSLLRQAQPALRVPADAKALLVLGTATYAGEEKLTWALRGMDPSLYAGYDLLTVAADGITKPLLQPGRSTLPWDAPLPG